MEKNSKILLKRVTQNDFKFLYELLRLRDSKENISHKEIPTYQQHVKFVKSKPYSKWELVYYYNKKIGTMYISKQNEVGIHLRKNFDKSEIRKSILSSIVKKNPNKRYLINASPKNKKLMQFLKDNGCPLIQYTYELNKDKFA